MLNLFRQVWALNAVKVPCGCEWKKLICHRLLADEAVFRCYANQQNNSVCFCLLRLTTLYHYLSFLSSNSQLVLASPSFSPLNLSLLHSFLAFFLPMILRSSQGHFLYATVDHYIALHFVKESFA